MTVQPARRGVRAKSRNKWAAAMWLVAITLVVAGQVNLAHDRRDPTEGIVYYLMGVALMAGVAVWRTPELLEPTRAACLALWSLLNRATSQPARVVAFFSSIALAYLGLRTLHGKPASAPHEDVFAMWLLSVILVVAAFLPVGVAQRFAWRRHRVEIGVVLLLTALAATLRLVALGAVPNVVSGDEGVIGTLTRRALDGELKNMFSTTFGQSTLYLFLFKAPYSLLGVHTMSMRIIPALGGILTVPAVYALGRRLFDARIAACAAGFVAISHFHIHFSRIAVATAIFDGLFTVVAVFLFYGGLSRGRAQHLALSGSIAALHLYVYMGGRLTALFLLAVVVALVVLQPRLVRENLAGLASFAVSYLVVATPMLLWIVSHPADFMARVNQVGIVQTGWLANEVKRTGLPEWRIYLDQLRHSLLAFNYYPAVAFYNSPWPMLDALIAVPAVLGLVYTTLRFSSLKSLLLLAWFWSAVVGGQVMMLTPQVNVYRILIVLPCVMLFAGIGLVRTVELGAHLLGLLLNKVNRLLLAYLVVAGFANVRFYVRDFAATCVYEDNVTRLASHMGAYLGTLPRDYKGYLLGAPRIMYGTHPSVDFLSGKLPVLNVEHTGAIDAELVEAGKRSVFLFVPERYSEIGHVESVFPGGSWSELTDCGEVVMRVYDTGGSAQRVARLGLDAF